MDEAKVKMEEVKLKAKAFMKSFNSPFGARSNTGSSSGQAFKGQGHRLGGGGGAESSSGTPCNGARKLGPGFCDQRQQQSDVRRLQQEKWERERGVAPAYPSNRGEVKNHAHGFEAPAHVVQSGGSVSSAAASVRSSAPDDRLRVQREPRETVQVGNFAPTNHNWSNGGGTSSSFDPYSPLIASGTSHRPAVAGEFRASKSQGQFQCPICQKWYQTEAQVSSHIDHCARSGEPELAGLTIGNDGGSGGIGQRQAAESYSTDDLEESVAILLSGAPSSATIEVTLKVFNNIITTPDEVKYRKIKLSNPRFQETIASAVGGIEFLESFGFRRVIEGGEEYVLMSQPSIEQRNRLQAAILYLEAHDSKTTEAPSPATSQPTTISSDFDRKLKIYYSRNDSRVEQFDVPDAFYRLSASEVKSEAAARRKKIEDSQLLIPKSYREKQAANVRRRHHVTILRIQLPDGLIVECLFRPGEPTTNLYEFVASLLKDSHETFDLVLPASIKHRVIPRFPDASGHCLTIEETDLVPKAMLKLSPTGQQGYTCLKNEYYALCEPLK